MFILLTLRKSVITPKKDPPIPDPPFSRWKVMYACILLICGNIEHFFTFGPPIKNNVD